jgi:Rrf2 family protein
MHISSRLAVSVHILGLLHAFGGDAPMSSEEIAGSVNTNPAVIRRMLGMLAKAGLVTSRLGAGGGALLAKRPREISLGDVYRAVEHGELFAMHDAPNPRCPVGRSINDVLASHFHRADAAMLRELDRTTIADIASAVQRAPLKRGA